VGLSAHSYSKFSRFGERFWNPNNIDVYVKKIKKLAISETPFKSILEDRKEDEYEQLKMHQSLTDFCHTSLRLKRGLSKIKLTEKFGHQIYEIVKNQCDIMLKLGWLEELENHWFLSKKGVLISNQIFSKLTFLAEELKKD
jgi:oxygen-independent coproporphyrinogen-3 oxidase